jgi:hypothetical protein
MKKKLFLIEYEGAHWCGGISHCVVVAEDEVEAESEAEAYMDESMRELFADEYQDDLEDGGNADDDVAYTVRSIEEFGPEHENWKWFLDYDQRSNFYPCINFEFDDIVK